MTITETDRNLFKWSSYSLLNNLLPLCFARLPVVGPSLALKNQEKPFQSVFEPILNMQCQAAIHKLQAEHGPKDRLISYLTYPIIGSAIVSTVSGFFKAPIRARSFFDFPKDQEGYISAVKKPGSFKTFCGNLQTAAAIEFLPQAANLYVVGRRAFLGLKDCWNRFKATEEERRISAKQALLIGSCHLFNVAAATTLSWFAFNTSKQTLLQDIHSSQGYALQLATERVEEKNTLTRYENATQTCLA